MAHVAYSSSSNYRQHHKSDVVTKEKSGGGRFKLSSLKGKSWSSFVEAVGYESSEDDIDDQQATTAASHHNSRRLRGSASFVRLKHGDSSLYGYCPQTDPFVVGICRHCRMVLKLSALKNHVDRERNEKERKHELGEAVVKLEKLSERSTVDKTTGVTEKFDKISVVVDKFEKSTVPALPVPSFSGAVEKVEKVEKVAEPKRHRHFQRKSATPSENSNDTIHFETLPSATESSSASNSPQPRRRKRKHVEEVLETATFQSSTAVAPTTCRIIVEPQEIVIRDPSSPPPLAPITNEPQPSVWIVTPASPAVLIDGAFMMKPLEQEEPEIDLKDLKVLKPPMVKDSLPETQTLLTPSNWYATQPRPLCVNTFNMRKLNTQYVMATQRKLIELGRNLRTEEKVVGAPKTWSFIEQRSQVFIPFRVNTH